MTKIIKVYSLRIFQVLIIALLLTTAAKLLFGWWQCPIKALTGLPCGGCGMLTASNALMHGNIMGAWQANPLIFVLAAYYLYISAVYILGKLKSINYKLHAIILAAIFIIIWMLRIGSII